MFESPISPFLEELKNLNDLNAIDKGYYVLTSLLMRYFRLSLKGLSHLPQTKGALIIANHGSLTALDGMLLARIIHQQTGRIPKVMLHRAWFSNPVFAKVADLMHGVKAGYIESLKLLKAGEIVLMFPEGEAGNFKAIDKRYQIQPFRKGFVYLAAEAGVPVIAACIVGAEEANINWGFIRTKGIIDIPLPLNIIPLPAKWMIQFLPPINLNGLKGASHQDLEKKAEAVQKKVQTQLHYMLESRKYVYLPDQIEDIVKAGQSYLLALDFSKWLK